MSDYTGQHIWIIGASTGIGCALVKELAGQGATLALSARSEDKLTELNDALGGKHHVFPLDVSDLEMFKNTAKGVEEAFPRIDSIINLAAIYEPSRIDEMDINSAYKMVDVNLKGTLNVIYVTLPILKAQKTGQIALCGSVAGYRGLAGGQPYSATKAAVINLTESLRTEHPELDIKIINPGFVRTPLTDKNDFKMPMMIEPADAAKVIAKDLQTGKYEIHFPKKFTWIMKILRILPAPIFLYIAEKMKSE